MHVGRVQLFIACCFEKKIGRVYFIAKDIGMFIMLINLKLFIFPCSDIITKEHSLFIRKHLFFLLTNVA